MHNQQTCSAERQEVLTATRHHPYARLSIAGAEELRPYLADRVTGWLRIGGGGRSFAALGDGPAAVALVRSLAAGGELAGVHRLHLPRVPDQLLAGLPIGAPDHWDLRWTHRVPPGQPGQDRVLPLAEPHWPAIGTLLREAFPGSFSRPGDPRVRCWYGVRDGDRLVACGADRSRGGVGSIGAVAVHPDWRGRGLGAALTAAIATRLFREFDVVTLGVMVDNRVATRLYQRLGFEALTARSSVDLRG